MSIIKIYNIGAICKLDCQLDLNILAQKQNLFDSSYNPDKYPALIIRKQFPTHTIQIYSSGSIIILGCKSVKDAEWAGELVATDTSLWLNKKIAIKQFKITNITAGCNIGYRIDTSALSDDILSLKTNKFPAVSYKLGSPIKSVQVFHTGSLMFNGAKTYEDIVKSYEIMKERLAKYRYKEP